MAIDILKLAQEVPWVVQPTFTYWSLVSHVAGVDPAGQPETDIRVLCMTQWPSDARDEMRQMARTARGLGFRVTAEAMDWCELQHPRTRQTISLEIIEKTAAPASEYNFALAEHGGAWQGGDIPVFVTWQRS